MSFRVNTGLRLALEDEAKRLGVNMNTLVCKIFNQYANWERYADRMKLLPVSKDILREMFQPFHKEMIEATARRLGESSAKEQVLFLFHQLNLGTVVRFIELWGEHFEATEHTSDGKRHYFTMRHDINLNFSVFAKEYLSALLRGALAKNVLFESLSPNSVTFSFEP